MSIYDAIDPCKAILWLPLRDSYVSGGGMMVTSNLGTAAGAPADVQLGDGITSGTYPTQFYPRGFLFNGTSNYLRANVVLPNATYTLGFVIQHVAYGAARYVFDLRAGGGSGYMQVVPTVTPPAATISAPGFTTSLNGIVTNTFYRGAVSVLTTKGVAAVPSYLAFGVHNGLGSSYFAGKLLALSLFPGDLTALQMAEWGRRALQEARLD